MDKDRLPRWGWLILGLVIAAFISGLINAVVLRPYGFPVEWDVVTTIAAMAPVIVFLGVWYDETRQEYWEHSDLRIVADVAFVVIGALLGASLVMLLLIDTGLHRLLRDIITMGGGFILGWGLFYFRNPEVYRNAAERRNQN